MLYFSKGYEENVRDLVNGAVFSEDHDELVIVKDIEVFSVSRMLLGTLENGLCRDLHLLSLRQDHVIESLSANWRSFYHYKSMLTSL